MPILGGRARQADQLAGAAAAGLEPARLAARSSTPPRRDLVLHPVGTLQVSQRAVPLDLTLDKVGSQKPSDAQPVRADASPRAAWPRRATCRSRSRPPSSRTSTTPPSCRSRPSSRRTAASSSRRRRRRYASGTALTRDRPLRRHDHRHQAAAAVADRFFGYPARLFQPLPAAATRSPAAPLSRDAEALTQPVRRRRSPSRAETFAVARQADNTVLRADAAAFTSQAAAQRLPRPRGRRRPEPGRHAARAAAVRGGRMNPIADLLVPAVAAPGHRQHDHRRRRRRRPCKTRAAIARRRCSSTGDPVGGGAELTATVAQDIALYGPGDIVGIDARARRPHRAARLDHQFRGELPRRDRLLRRGLPLALHAGRARRRPAAPAAVDRAGRAAPRSEFAEGQDIAGRPLPYITIADAERASRPPTSCGPGRTCTSTRALAGAPGELVSHRHDRGAAAGRRRCSSQNPRPRATRGSLCPRRLGRQHRLPRVRRPDLRDRPAGRPRPGPRRRAARDVLGVGRLRRPARAGPSYPGLLPLVLPHRLARRLRVPGAAARSRSRSTRASARATWTCRTPARTCPASPSRARRRPAARRRAAGARRRPRRRRAGRAAGVRELGPAVSRTRSRRRWPRSSTCPTTTPRRPRPTPTPRPASAQASTDDPDPLITAPLYGRWHALTQRLLTEPRRHAGRRTRQNWVHRLNLDPRFRVAAGFGARRGRGERRRPTWTTPGSRSATCWRPTSGSGACTSRPRSPRAGTTAT